MLKLIYINVAIFLLLRLTWVVLMLFNIDGYVILPFIEMPSIPYEFITHPWTLLTYMFVHYDVWHILFNMLWLYWFGQIFLMSFSENNGRAISFRRYSRWFIISAFVQFVSLFRWQRRIDVRSLCLDNRHCRSHGIPNARLQSQPAFLGAISLKYIALVTIIIDLLSVTSANGGGHIAHLGGALLGYWFIVRWEKGKI